MKRILLFNVCLQQKWDTFGTIVKRHFTACSAAGESLKLEKGVSHGTTDISKV